jgi:hypothetical protein
MSHSLKDLKKLLQAQLPVKVADPIGTGQATVPMKKVQSDQQAIESNRKEINEPINLSSNSQAIENDRLRLKRIVQEQEAEISTLKTRLIISERDLKKSKSDLENVSVRLQSAEKEISLAIKKQQELRRERDQWRSEHNHIQDRIEAQARVARDALSKLRHLGIKNAEYQYKIEKSDQKVARLEETIYELQAQVDFGTAFSVDNLAVLDWVTSGTSFRDLDLDSPYISVIGDEPLNKGEFDAWLRKKGFRPVKAEDPKASLLLLGRTANEFEIEGHLMEKIGEEIRVFSQELLIASLIAGMDPFSQSKAFQNKALKPFAEGHPGLTYLRALHLPWPSLDISENFELVYTYDDSVTETPLHAVGYRVGVTAGLSTVKRHELLRDVFNGLYDEHPNWHVESDEYMSTWGQPRTRRRLCRMAYHIASQIANKKRRKNHERAVDEWRNDLDWIRKNLYQKSFKFAWPNVSV